MVKETNIKKLVKYFDDYMTSFYRLVPFSDEQLESYRYVLSFRKTQSLKDHLDSEEYHRELYNTLDMWDMNKRAAEMKPFDQFSSSISSNKERFLKLKDYKLTELEKSEFKEVQKKATNLYSNLSIMKSHSNLVANSKLMHFVLPDLIMPVDRAVKSNKSEFLKLLHRIVDFLLWYKV